jgi:hypothetical protein
MGLTKQENLIFSKYELEAKKKAVFEDGEFSYYQDEIDDVVYSCYLEIVELAKLVLPRLRSGELKLNELDEILKHKTINEFADFIKSYSNQFPMLDGYIETLQDFIWTPIHDAIRELFTLDLISKIDNQLDFDIALIGYCDGPELYNYYTDINVARNVIEIINCLNLMTFSSKDQQEKIRVVSEKMQYVVENFTPSKTLDFEGSSFGMEDVITKWISKLTEIQFDDDDFEVSNELQDVNLEALKNSWLKMCAFEEPAAENLFWLLVDSDISTNFSTERKFLGKKKNKTVINVLYQLHERTTSDSEPIPLEKWRICLLRTGIREEYDSSNDAAVLAGQVLIACKVLETAYDNVSGEIVWLRLNEKDSPLASTSEARAIDMAKAYFESK